MKQLFDLVSFSLPFTIYNYLTFSQENKLERGKKDYNAATLHMRFLKKCSY